MVNCCTSCGGDVLLKQVCSLRLPCFFHFKGHTNKMRHCEFLYRHSVSKSKVWGIFTECISNTVMCSEFQGWWGTDSSRVRFYSQPFNWQIVYTNDNWPCFKRYQHSSLTFYSSKRQEIERIWSVPSSQFMFLLKKSKKRGVHLKFWPSVKF